jgi:protein TonB
VLKSPRRSPNAKLAKRNVKRNESAVVHHETGLANHLLICAKRNDTRWEAFTVTRNTISTAEVDESIGSSRRSGLEPLIVGPVVSTAGARVLFEDILLDSNAAQRKRRTWPTLISFVLQLSLVGVLLLLPLWFTDVLPKQQLLVFLEAPPPPPPPPPPAASTPPTPKVVKVTSNIANGRLRTPSKIPAKVLMIEEEDAPPPAVITGVVGGVPGGIPGGQLGGVIGGIISASSSPAAAPPLSKPAPAVQRIRISQGVIQGLLIFKVEPTYPPLAQQARIQGAVVMTALIDKGGNVQRLQVVSGHPLLAPAAIEAVKQWRYKPFVLNGQPLEVETTVTVNFHLRSQ